MDVIRLRVLTEKSTLGFGQYADCTVQQILDLNKTKYLRWVYYNCSNISFCDSILKKIYVFEEEKIKKPGTNKELCEKINNKMIGAIDDFNNLKHLAHAKRIRKAKFINKKINDSIRYSKKNLQAKNHGH